MPRIVAAACLAALLVLSAVAVFTQSAWAGPLRMGILPVLDTLPLQVAVRDGLFQDQGLDVELVPFASALERDTAMQSGRLDGYFGDLVATLLLMRQGAPMRIATVSWSASPGQRMFAIVRAAKGKGGQGATVGISRSTVMEFLLDAMAAHHDLPRRDWEVVEVKKIPIRMQMLLSGQLDMALLPEPLAGLAQSRGATVVATDEMLQVDDRGMPLTVLCLRKDLPTADLYAFLRAYGEAVAALAAHPEAYRKLMAETCRIPPDLAKDFPVYAYPAPRLPTEAEVGMVQDWMIGKGMLDARLPYAGLVPEAR